MTIASIGLFFLVTALLVFDFVTLRKEGRKILMLEAAAFLVAQFLIVRQDIATLIANKVGIWRGVDFVIYPVIVWLFREALLSRHARWVEAKRLDRFVRAVALRNAHVMQAAGKTFS
jgi:hypothetical protein